MKAVLIDTGAWIALLSNTDQHAERALAYYQALSAGGTSLITTNYVVDETATRLRFGAGLPAALGLRRMLDDAVRSRRLRVAWIDEPLERSGWEIMEQYAAVPLSLTDATSVACARQNKIGEVFGFDRDFEACGLLVQPLR